MDEAGLRLDGNAAAGLLREIFGREMTVACGTCTSCGAVGQLGGVHVYMQAPGVVVRCPSCTQVLMRVVRGRDRYWLEMLGVRGVEILF